jgi:hypothetical protein
MSPALWPQFLQCAAQECESRNFPEDGSLNPFRNRQWSLMMKSLSKIALGAMVSASLLALSAASASAAIVCSGDVCWHTHESYRYPGEAHVIIHPDGWRWGPTERYSWREHEGRGYWHGGDWRDW